MITRLCILRNGQTFSRWYNFYLWVAESFLLIYFFKDFSVYTGDTDEIYWSVILLSCILFWCRVILTSQNELGSSSLIFSGKNCVELVLILFKFSEKPSGLGNFLSGSFKIAKFIFLNSYTAIQITCFILNDLWLIVLFHELIYSVSVIKSVPVKLYQSFIIFFDIYMICIDSLCLITFISNLGLLSFVSLAKGLSILMKLL